MSSWLRGSLASLYLLKATSERISFSKHLAALKKPALTKEARNFHCTQGRQQRSNLTFLETHSAPRGSTTPAKKFNVWNEKPLLQSVTHSKGNFVVTRRCNYFSTSQKAGNLGSMSTFGVTIVSNDSNSFLNRCRAKFGANQRSFVVLGHSASLFAVLAIFMKDMLWLRTFMVCGSTLGVLFNLLQPRPLKIPAVWGCVLVILNLFQIGVLLHERRPVHFKSEEAEVYAIVFQKHGVTPHQFEKLIHKSEAVWREFPEGHVILKEGDMVEAVGVLMKGRADVLKGGEVVGELSAGCLVGETALLVEGHRAGHSVVTAEQCTLVEWPRDKLSQMLACDEHLKLSTAQIINSDLAAKLQNSANVASRAKALETYQEVVRAMLLERVIHPSQKRALREYRAAHAITPDQHSRVLLMCGWSVEEFEDGIKADHREKTLSMARVALSDVANESGTRPSLKD